MRLFIFINHCKSYRGVLKYAVEETSGKREQAHICARVDTAKSRSNKILQGVNCSYD